MLDLSVQDFAALISGETPTGDAWPTEPDSVQQQVFAALAGTFKRLHDQANALVVDAFPATTVQLLPDWETATGLPDPCTGPLPTIALRQAAVVAKLVSRGGQSIPYFVGVAAALGFEITVTEFAPARFDQPFGDFAGEAWAHTWQVNIPPDLVQLFPFDEGRFGEPFATYGDLVLTCTLNRIKPAHTVLLTQTEVIPSGETEAIWSDGTAMLFSDGTPIAFSSGGGTPAIYSDGTPILFSDGTPVQFAS